MRIRNVIKVESNKRCVSCNGKVNLYLEIRRLREAESLDTKEPISRENAAIFPGCKIKTPNGFVSDYLKITGNCEICRLEHRAKLEVKQGIVVGIKDGTYYGITEGEKKKLKEMTGSD